jgi:hypothetical protein
VIPGRLLFSKDAEYQPDGAVYFSCLCGIQVAGEVPKPRSVDCAHLVDEHAGPDSVHFDLWSEDRGLRAGGSRRDDQRGEQYPVALDRDRVPRSALLTSGRVLVGAKPEQVTTH